MTRNTMKTACNYFVIPLVGHIDFKFDIPQTACLDCFCSFEQRGEVYHPCWSIDDVAKSILKEGYLKTKAD